MRRCLWGLSLGLALQACAVAQDGVQADLTTPPVPPRVPFLPFGADRLAPRVPLPPTEPEAAPASEPFLSPPAPALVAARMIELPRRATTGSAAATFSDVSQSATSVLAGVLRDERSVAVESATLASAIPRAVVADAASDKSAIPAPTVTPAAPESLGDALTEEPGGTVVPDYDPPPPRRTYRTPESPAESTTSAQALLFERARLRAQLRLARMEGAKSRGQSISRPQIGPAGYEAHATVVSPYPWFSAPYWQRIYPR